MRPSLEIGVRCRAGIVLLTVLAGGLATCRGSSPDPSARAAVAPGDAASDARENERQAQEDLSQPNKAEARAWLADPGHALFEGDRAEVVDFVGKLYEQGAPEVYVTGIDTLGQTPVTASLVVVLPADASSRAKVFQTVGALLTAMGETALPDVGQKHVFIALD